MIGGLSEQNVINYDILKVNRYFVSLFGCLMLYLCIAEQCILKVSYTSAFQT
jgi:hypothetical protein